MKSHKTFLVLLVAALVVSCGSQTQQVENYNLTSVADLTLSAANHPHGYAKSQCFFCHIQNNIHQVDRIGAPNFDIAQTLVQQSGLASCSGCHGTNGVP